MRFLKSLPPHSWGADIGCGNGKYLITVNKEKLPLAPILASDSSSRLLEVVRDRGFDAVVANLLSLPYRPNTLDFFICVAVLHHLSTPQRRLEGLKSLASILKVGGLGLIQVWARDQHWKGHSTSYVNDNTEGVALEMAVIPGGSVLPVQKPRTPFVASDVLLPWNTTRRKG